jgi:cell wall-associated NlpC family hydrolase
LYSKHKVVKAVGAAIKAPFVDGGRDISVGLDCWGLVKYIAHSAFEMEIPDFHIGAMDKHKIYFQFLEKTKKEFTPIYLHEIKPGDFVGMNMIVEMPNLVHHFGIFVEPKRFIHTLEKQGPQLTYISDAAYKNRIRGFYRWNGSK